MNNFILFFDLSTIKTIYLKYNPCVRANVFFYGSKIKCKIKLLSVFIFGLYDQIIQYIIYNFLFYIMYFYNTFMLFST